MKKAFVWTASYLVFSSLMMYICHMYIKTIRKYCKAEKTTHNYYRLCESYRDEWGFPRQRMVLGLCRLVEIPDIEQKHTRGWGRIVVPSIPPPAKNRCLFKKQGLDRGTNQPGDHPHYQPGRLPCLGIQDRIVD